MLMLESVVKPRLRPSGEKKSPTTCEAPRMGVATRSPTLRMLSPEPTTVAIMCPSGEMAICLLCAVSRTAAPIG